MRISATGRLEAYELGFTLIELLIVMTIIGLMSASVILAMPERGGSLRSEAEGFAARAGAAREQAVLGARPLAVRVSADGYGFDRRQAEAWQPIEGDALSSYQWNEGTVAATRAGDSARIVFDSTGMAEPAQIILRRGDDQIAVDIGIDGKVEVRG